MKIKSLLFIFLLLISTGCSVLEKKPDLVYYGQIELIKSDKSEFTVLFDKYVDANGANIDVNNEVNVTSEAAKALPKEAQEGDRIKVSIAKDNNGEQLVQKIEIISPGNHK